MERRFGCEARQYSDQMNCHLCGLVWDMNDPAPPECKPKQARNRWDETAEQRFDQLRRQIDG